MKKPTYKAIDALTTRIKDVLSEIETAKGKMEDFQSEAEGQFDDRSEKWQDGEAGQVESEQIERLRSLITTLETIEEEMRSFIETSEEIQGDAPEGSFN